MLKGWVSTLYGGITLVWSGKSRVKGLSNNSFHPALDWCKILILQGLCMWGRAQRLARQRIVGHSKGGRNVCELRIEADHCLTALPNGLSQTYHLNSAYLIWSAMSTELRSLLASENYHASATIYNNFFRFQSRSQSTGKVRILFSSTTLD